MLGALSSFGNFQSVKTPFENFIERKSKTTAKCSGGRKPGTDWHISPQNTINPCNCQSFSLESIQYPHQIVYPCLTGAQIIDREIHSFPQVHSINIAFVIP